MKNLFILFSILLCFGLESCLTGGGSSGNRKTNTTPGGASSGSITTFVIKDNFMYTLDHKVLLTHDLTDPDQPELVHTLEIEYGLETIFLYDDHIYVGSTTSLFIINVDLPATPKFISKTERAVEFINGCDPVIVKDNMAYSTVKIIVNRCGRVGSRSALLIYDVTDKHSPQEVGHFIMDEPNGLAIKENFLFVCDKASNRVVLFDITNPNSAILKQGHHLTVANAYDIIIKNNRMIVSSTDGFQIFDVTDINDIFKIGTIHA